LVGRQRLRVHLRAGLGGRGGGGEFARLSAFPALLRLCSNGAGVTFRLLAELIGIFVLQLQGKAQGLLAPLFLGQLARARREFGLGFGGTGG
jgi:hypothetical protein